MAMQRGFLMNDLAVPDGKALEQNTDDLSRVVKKALKQIEDILDMEMPVATIAVQAKILSLKKDAAASIINAGLKADENRFRRENKDIVERLFDKIRKDGKIVDGQIKRKD